MNKWVSTSSTEKIGLLRYEWAPSYPKNFNLLIDVGQRIYLIEKCGSMYRAAAYIGTSPTLFLIPTSYVKLIPSCEKPIKSSQYIYHEKNGLSQLIHDILQAWISATRTTIVNISLYKLISLMKELTAIRRNMMDRTFKVSEELVINLINEGNEIFGMEYIPYLHNKFITVGNSTLREVFQTHKDFKFDSNTNISQEPLSEIQTLVKRSSTDNEIFLALYFDRILSDQTEPTSWVFGIYDVGNKMYFTETFTYEISDVTNKDLNIPKTTAIFKLPESIVNRQIYLFIRVFRFVPLGVEKRNDGINGYRRPYAITGIPLCNVFKNPPQVQNSEKISLYNVSEVEYGGFECLLTRIPTEIKIGSTSNLSIEVVLTRFHGTFQNLKIERPSIFDRSYPIIPYLGLPDVITPNLVQNDFYITLKMASFDKCVLKGKQMNIEASVTAWSSNQLLTKCIKVGNYKGAELITEYKSFIIQHCNQPEWNETIGFVFPSNKMESLRIIVSFSHISSSSGKSKTEKMNLLGVSVIRPQLSDRLVLGGCEKKYSIKKYETSPKSQNSTLFDDPKKLNTYFREEFEIPELSLGDGMTPVEKDFVKITFRLYSTIFTSNREVHHIKENNKQTPNTLSVLSKFLYIDPIESIYYIGPIFRNFIQMFPPIDEKGENLIFSLAFYKIINIGAIAYPKFVTIFNDTITSTEMPMFWKYILQHFKFCVNRINIESNKTEFQIVQEIFKITYTNYIFKIILHSYEEFKMKYPDSKESLVKQLIDYFSDLFNVFKTNSLKHLLLLLILTLRRFTSVLDNINKILSHSDCIHLVNMLLNSIPNTYKYTENDNTILNYELTTHKIYFLRQMTNMEKFMHAEFRDGVMPSVFSSIKSTLEEDPENIEISIEIADLFMNIVVYIEKNSKLNIVKMVVNHLVNIFVQCNQDNLPAAPHSPKVSTMNILLSLFSCLPEEMFTFCFLAEKNKDDIAKLLPWYRIFSNIFIEKIFPASYVVTWVAVCKELLKITQFLMPNLKAAFSSQDKNEQTIRLMHHFFDFTLGFINCPCFETHNIISITLTEYMLKSEDMRVNMAKIMFQLWGELDHANVGHLYDYAQTLVTTSLIDVPALRSIMFHILFDFLIFDFRSTGNMNHVTRIIISYIDSDAYTVDKYKVFSKDFKEITERLWSTCHEDSIKTVGQDSTRQILEIIDTITYYSIPEKFEDCTFLHAYRAHQMIEFHKKISHREMVQNNIVRLLNYNEIMESHTEAAMCYLKLSEYYTWDNFEMLPKMNRFEPSTHRVRKERFIRKAMELFNRNFNLEMAIESCHKLLPLYLEHEFDYIQVSKLYTSISDFTERIAQGESSIDTFYRLNFIGLDFPESIQNKSFVCHMGSCASLGFVMTFIKKQFPNAQLPNTSTFDENLRQKNVQFVFIQVVKSLPSDKDLYEKVYLVSETISRYYKTFNTTHFLGTVTVENQKEKIAAGFPNFIFTKTFITVAYPLPTLVMISLLLDEKKTIMSDFDQNYELITSFTNDLYDVCRNYLLNPALIKEIQMKSSGCLNAFVNGGLSMVIPKYFSESYLLENPGSEDKIELLNIAICGYMSANAKALRILVKQLGNTMPGFVNNLVDSYQMMRDTLDKKAGVTSEDLSYLVDENSVPISQSTSGSASARTGSVVQSGSIVSTDTNPSLRVTNDRKDTASSLDSKGKDSGYNTLKFSQAVRALSKYAHHDDEKSRCSSIKSSDKSVQPETKEITGSSTLSYKIKKKYSIFHPKHK